MNNPNPFVPHGSLLEQVNKKRARMKMAVLTIFSGTILLIVPALLFQGCNRGAQSSQTDSTGATADSASDLTSSNGAQVAATGPDVSASTNVTATAAVPPVPPVAQVQQPVQPPAPETTTYTVVAHDTLATIAKSHNVKLKDLEAANPGVVPTKLSVGKQLNIPAPSTSVASMTGGGAADSTSDDTYTVKSGDNLTRIATKNGTTVKAIMDLNKMTSTRINAGEKLKMPAKAATASTATVAPIDAMSAQTTTASNPTSPTSGAPVLR